MQWFDEVRQEPHGHPAIEGDGLSLTPEDAEQMRSQPSVVGQFESGS